VPMVTDFNYTEETKAMWQIVNDTRAEPPNGGPRW